MISNEVFEKSMIKSLVQAGAIARLSILLEIMNIMELIWDAQTILEKK